MNAWLLGLVLLLWLLLRPRETQAEPTMPAGEQLSEHFNADEFKLAGAPVQVVEGYRQLCEGTLEPLRKMTGDHPLIVTPHGGWHYPDTPASRPKGSRHRTAATRPLNHQTGYATDVYSKAMQPEDLADLALSLMANGVIPKGGLAVYKTFLHIDDRGEFRSWNTGSHKALVWPGQQLDLSQSGSTDGDETQEA